MRHFRFAVILVALFVRAETLWAERKNTLGTQLDFVSGMSNWTPVNGLNLGPFQTVTPFYVVYSSIEMKSMGPHSALDLSYTFGLQRIKSELDVDSESHVLAASFDKTLSQKWKFKLKESFEMTPDFATFSALRGILFTPQGAQFLYYPIAVRRSSQINSASISVDYDFSPRSTLSFGLSHVSRDYEDNPQFRGLLSDQYRMQGNVSYTRKIDERTSWGLEYSASQLHFEDFDDARMHNISAVYSRQLRPTLKVRLAAGPSYVETLTSERNYPGYVASLSLEKSTRSNRLSLYYDRRTGESTGLGSISDTHNAGFGFSRLLGRRTTLALDASGFSTRHRLDNPADLRGATGSVTLGLPLTDKISLNGGALYRMHFLPRWAGDSRYSQATRLDVEEKRIFFSFRFRAPEFWRFAQ
jgi:hypothetical protein